MTLVRVTLACWLCLATTAVFRPALAHELRPAVLSLVERTPGTFAVRYTLPVSGRGQELALSPSFPEHCWIDGSTLECGERGLDGALAFPELPGTLSRVAVRVDWLDGTRTAHILDSERPELLLRGLGRNAAVRDRLELARDYLELGVEHILTGLDHLAFVVGLTLLVGFARRLFWTVTAFTVAHSVTLGLASLRIFVAPGGAVELVIALSILLLAVECAGRRETWTHRAPWLVAFSFGLLHGFGFAGALEEIGLPPYQTPLALLGFNLGVELGQLGVIAAAWVLARFAVAGGSGRFERRGVGFRGRFEPAKVRVAVVYALGVLGAYWTLERAWVLFA